MTKKDWSSVWTDLNTQLMWQVSLDDEKFVWCEIQKYADTLNKKKYGGFSDWRVPTRFELETIQTRRSRKNKLGRKGKLFIKKPLIHSMRFDHQSFWSLSLAEEEDDGRERAFLVNFFYPKGIMHSGYASYSKHVRCVRC